jgi:hypothetical protein
VVVLLVLVVVVVVCLGLCNTPNRTTVDRMSHFDTLDCLLGRAGRFRSALAKVHSGKQDRMINNAHDSSRSLYWDLT